MKILGLISWRQDLSLNLELGWWPENFCGPAVPTTHPQPAFHMYTLGSELGSSYSPSKCSYPRSVKPLLSPGVSD